MLGPERALSLVALVNAGSSLIHGPWSDVLKSPEARAQALVANMTITEKIMMMHGPATGPCCSCNTSALCAYVGNIAPNARLGIPPINMNDGPQGFRDNVHPGTTTAWPSGLTMAATFDVAAMLEWGEGMGREFYGKGANVQLGPGLCLARVPRNGRNFEYLSGEDPFLGYTLVQPVISGIQSQKVVANAKHYILNNQETNRQAVNEEADERTRFEMYYPPFAGASKADVGSIMCSYNKINGAWSCENPITLAQNLKVDVGFKGYVMSDWGATHSTSVMQGLDVEMPGAGYMNQELIQAGLAAGTITESAVDDSVYRILRAMFAVGVMDEPLSAWDWHKQTTNTTTASSIDSCRRLSAASTVLLKNEGSLLPLPQDKTLALIGFATDGAVVHGGGSGSVVPSYVVSPMEGILAQAGAAATVSFDDGTNLQTASALAAKSDYAIVFVGTLSHEGGDRASLSLDDGCEVSPGNQNQCKGNNKNQNAMVSAIAAANKNTIVVASVPGAILMPWSTEVSSILTNFMPGQQAGNAIADILFGSVNPSARLPITMPNKDNETNFSPEQWPGLPNPSDPVYAVYSEKLLVGYRYYDAHNISFTSGFPFGHGLSYTSFAYSGLSVEGATSVACTVTNTGKTAGAEVAQLYLTFPSVAGEPPMQMKGFIKTRVLKSGESAMLLFPLTQRDLSIWDVNSHNFQAVIGTFQVHVGSSSRDIRLQGSLLNA